MTQTGSWQDKYDDLFSLFLDESMKNEIYDIIPLLAVIFSVEKYLLLLLHGKNKKLSADTKRIYERWRKIRLINIESTLSP